jgi:Inner membrane component of T3SS, cytoplasmic domain
MVQLNILSGKKAGSRWVVRHFPFQVGRAAESDLQLEDDGVWDAHLAVEFHRSQGFVAKAHPNALATVNGQSVQAQSLHNGDIIGLGSVKIQFWLAAMHQRRLSPREMFVWALIAVVCVTQFGLIYWLIS